MLTLTSDLIIGHPIIDADHQRLIDIINEFETNSKSLANEKLMSDTMKALYQYGVDHFVREERIQKECMYPELASHCAEHKMLLEKVADSARDHFVTKVKEVNKKSLIQLNAFLQSWLIDHVKKHDTKMREWVGQDNTGTEIHKFNSSQVCALVISSNAKTRKKLVSFLSEMGASTIIEADDSALGLTMVFADPRPDLIFCDLNAKPIDGLAISAAAKHSWENSITWIPVVIMSDTYEASLSRKAFKAGAIGTFLNNFVPSEFSKFLRMIIKQPEPSPSAATSQAHLTKQFKNGSSSTMG